MKTPAAPFVRLFRAAGLAAVLALGTAVATAPQSFAQAKEKTSTPKAAKGEKVCRYRFPTGERRVWVCKREEPCCAWDAIKYVKCGSVITGCL